MPRKTPGAMGAVAALGAVLLAALACQGLGPPRITVDPATAVPTPLSATQTESAPPPSPTTPPTPTPTPVDAWTEALSVPPPEKDPIDLARRLKGVGPIPTALATSAQPLALGAVQSFIISNADTNEHTTIQAVLQAESPHVYLWLQSDLPANREALQRLADRFEERTYPTNQEYFGSEWSPGVDGDPHLYILFASGLGSSVAGYFSSMDEYPSAIHPASNQHEMFYINADVLDADSDFAGGVLAHEFQHMILWAHDRNEAAWVNEGLAGLAAYLNGYGSGGRGMLYLLNPDQQLNSWPGLGTQSTSHYGQSFLFLAYFLHRWGEGATRSLVAEPADGLQGIDAALAAEWGDGFRPADALFSDWAAANYINDPGLDSGQYAYAGLEAGVTAAVSEIVGDCPTDERTATVSQYGADYIRVTCPGPIAFHLSGTPRVAVLPTRIQDGQFAFWSNRGDESDMTLTRAFDFSSVSGAASMSFSAWYDLEGDYDYVYVEASTDGGKRWAILNTPSGTDANPIGNSYGWAYNGASGGGATPAWIDETVDLSQFAGQPEVLIRFEYVTDAAVNGAGFLLDRVRVDAIGYEADFETDDGGWQAEGFVRLRNELPQTFSVQAIERGREGTRVTLIEMDTSNAADYQTTLGGGVDELVIVVAGTTRGTEEVATYQYSVTR